MKGEVRQQRGPSELELYLCGRQDKKAKEMSRSLALLLNVRCDRQEDLGWAVTTKVLIRGRLSDGGAEFPSFSEGRGELRPEFTPGKPPLRVSAAFFKFWSDAARSNT